MSHDATNWAVKQRGISPAAKVVLWHLCDRHHPDHGCFPSQDRLAEDCEISRASLNNQLKSLEEAGLIIRVKRLDNVTKRQKSTRYILGFERDFAVNMDSRVQEVDTGAVSKNQADPCPKNDESRVQYLDTNPVREPLREPVSARASDFEEFWKAYPKRNGKRLGRKPSEAQYLKALKRATHDQIMVGVRSYTSHVGNFAKDPQRWLRDDGWQDESSDTPDINDQIKAWAQRINSGANLFGAKPSSAIATELHRRRLVDSQRLSEVME